ncbi:MAG: restriction endonuclease subunit S [Leptospiraceae bacterium]|nr:restriction endonuclease subunit S [Leptospiraceae bacterium]
MKWEKIEEIEFGNLYIEDSKNGIWKTSSFLGKGTSYIKMNELFAKKFIGDDLSYELIELTNSEKEKLLLRNEDLLFSRTSVVPEGVGKCSIIVNITNELVFDSNIIRIRLNPSICYPKYIFYYFNSPFGRGQVLSLANGTAIKTIKGSDLKKLRIQLLPLPTQRKIANILSAYDDLIENNSKRIKLLEEKAFLRYKMIVSGEKLEEVKLKEVARVNQSTLKGNSNLEKLLYVDIASVSTGNIDNKTEYDLKDAPGRAKRILNHEDIIWSCVRPNRKSYSFVFKPEDNLIASTGFAVITPTEIPSTFLYQLTITNEFVSYLENHAKGATYPAVTATDFEEATIYIPQSSSMIEYHEEIYRHFELKDILQKQNTKLREARDILLPRLMNGEIEV